MKTTFALILAALASLATLSAASAETVIIKRHGHPHYHPRPHFHGHRTVIIHR